MNANENKLMTACKAGNHAKVKEILLESKKNIRNATDVLMEAVKNNDIEMVHVLLSDEEFAKWGNTYFALKFAVQHNYFQIVDMLLQHPKTDSYFVDYRLLNEAVNFNSIQSVQLLLTDGRANPDSHDGIVISTACSMGFTEILMMLLQDPRVTPDTMNFSKALLQAVNNNHSDIVDIVLKDGRANPNISNGIVIRTACSRGNTEILMLLEYS